MTQTNPYAPPRAPVSDVQGGDGIAAAAAAGAHPIGDPIAIAHKSTVTEADLLKNALIAAGIPASVADANLIQAYDWLTNAAGGVRVLVPAAYAEQARLEMAEIERGAYALEGDDEAAAPAPQATDLALFPPDAAALWSFALTPLFGGVLHFLNARTLGEPGLMRRASFGLALNVVVTAVAIGLAIRADWNASAGWRASLIASAYTLLWYLAAAQSQSRHIAQSYGRRYVRRPLLPAIAAALAALAAVGAPGWF